MGGAAGDADLSNADLTEADLSGASLAEAAMGGATLDGADLSFVDLRGATLTESAAPPPRESRHSSFVTRSKKSFPLSELMFCIRS